MSAAAWVELAAPRPRHRRAGAPRSAPTWPRSTAAAGAPGDRVFGAIERLIYRLCGIDPDGRAALDDLRPARCWPSACVSVLVLYAQLRAAGPPAAQPRPLRRRRSRRCRSTPPISFLTNTNWQNYGDESTMSHLTQMAGLAVHNFVSAAAGACGGRRPHPGPASAAGPAPSATSGSTWSARACGSCCRWRSSSRSCCISQGVIQNLHGAADGAHRGRRRRQVDPRRPGGQPGGDQGGRAERRRLLQRQLGPPVREPQRHHQLLEILADPADPVRLHLHVRARWPGTRSRAGCVFAAMFVLWIAARRCWP